MNIGDTALFRKTYMLQKTYIEIKPLLRTQYVLKGFREGILKGYEDSVGISFYDTPVEIGKLRQELIKKCRTHEDLMYFVSKLGPMLGMNELAKCIKYYLSMESTAEMGRRFKNNHKCIQKMSKEKPRYIYRGIHPNSCRDGIFYSLDLFTAAAFTYRTRDGLPIDGYEKAVNGIIKGRIIEREFVWKDILYVIPNSVDKEIVLIPDRVKAGNEKIITPKEYKDIALKMDI